MEWHELIANRLEALEMSQDDLASAVGVSQSMISLYIKGKRTPPEHRWPALVAALEIGEEMLRQVPAIALAMQAAKAVDLQAAV